MPHPDARLLLEQLYGQHPDGFVALGSVRDADGALVDFEFRYLNPAGARALGREPGALEGQRLLPLLPEVLRSGRFALYARVVETGTPERVELCHPLPDRLLRVSALAVKWGDGVAITFTDVSARHAAEAERDAARAREDLHFRTLAEALPHIVWTAGADGAVDYASSLWFSYSGLSAEASLGWGWTQLIHPQGAQEYVEAWRGAIARGEPFENEVRFRRAADGAYRWHLVRAVPTRDAAGQLQRWVGTCTDVHAQREALEQQRLLTTIIEQSRDLIGVSDLRGRTRYLNAAGLALMGHASLEEALRLPVLERFVPTERERIREQVWPAVARDGHWEGETLLHHQVTGEPIPVHYSIFTVTDPRTGAPLGRAAITRDLRPERRLQAVHEAAERRFGSVFEQAAVGMMHVAPDGRLLRVNQRLCDFLGHAREELVGRNFRELTHPEDLERDLRIYEEVLAGTRDSYALEKRYFRKDGTALWVNLTVAVVREPGGAPDYFVTVVEDISARRALEQERDQLLGREYAQRLRAQQLVERRSRELAATQAQLAQAEKLAMAGQLAAGVAHEVNNPLAFLLSNLRYVQEDLTELGRQLGSSRFEELLQCVKEAHEGAERIRSIVRDLKAFARPDPDALETLALGEAVEFAASMVAHEVRLRARLQLDCAPQLAVRGHKTKLGQVLLNLLLNAAQAIPEGNAAAHLIRVSTRALPGGWAALEVQDSGAGIPAAHLSRIFDPFFTTKAVGEGSGLGLSVCHGIVKAMGGRIEVESREGEGSLFRVLLPLAASASTPAPAPLRLVAPAPAAAAPGSGRLLVVDDDEGVGTALRRSLGVHHEVHVVRSGRAALELLAQDPHFDTILCDVTMPDLSGVDVYERLAEQQPQLLPRLVLMTGGAFTPRAREFLASGRCELLEKPFDTERVLALVQARLAPPGRPRPAGQLPAARVLG